jgi:hypothetical protein
MKTNFDAYLRYEELTRILRARGAPRVLQGLVHRQELRGREIWFVELTNSQTGPANTKPAFWVDGNTHAGEIRARWRRCT